MKKIYQSTQGYWLCIECDDFAVECDCKEMEE